MQQPPAYGNQPQPGVVYTAAAQGPGQHVVVQSPAPVHTNYVVQNAQPPQDTCCGGSSEKYNATGGLSTGVLQLIIAVLSIVLSGASYAFPYWYIYSPYGIWSGIFFFMPAGILGIVSKGKNSCVVIGYLIMSILSCLEAFGMIAYEGALAGVYALAESCQYMCDYYYYDSCGYQCTDNSSQGAVAVHAVLALLGFIEFVVAIVGAAFCCGGLKCCCAGPSTSTTTTTTTYYGNQPVAQPHMVVAGQVPYNPGNKV